jgi:hypothetical protein
VMVDPFPNINKQTRKPEEEDRALFSILGPVIGAMRSQCMFKPQELLLGTSDDIYDRFLVAPIRHRKNDMNVVEKNPLASGFFEGFGGFMSYDFRKHDYHLGRRNCQQFLKYYFSLPASDIANNKIFKDKILDDFMVTPPKTTNNGHESASQQKRYPIIPLVGSLQDEEPTTEWPTYSSDEFNTFKKLLAERIMALSNRALPFAGLTNRLWVALIAIVIGIGLIHFYHYCKCGTWGEPCVTTAYYWFSFGAGLLEFVLMIVASVLIIFLAVLHILRVWAKTKVIELIESYLKDYKLNIK